MAAIPRVLDLSFKMSTYYGRSGESSAPDPMPAPRHDIRLGANNVLGPTADLVNF
jgi:hypothetical protein